MVVLVLLLMSMLAGYTQESVLLPDQNPRFKISLDKYLSDNNGYVVLQGTTSQETYKAINPLETRREQRAFRRSLRSYRPLRRHQRAMERIRNPRYATYRNYHRNYGSWDNWNWNSYYWGNDSYYDYLWDDWSTPDVLLGIGLAACFLF